MPPRSKSLRIFIRNAIFISISRLERYGAQARE
jgi:hypothetical protein